MHPQVRQHVPHKRTFFFLEQLILKHGADEHCVNIKDIHEVGQGGGVGWAGLATGVLSWAQSLRALRNAQGGVQVPGHAGSGLLLCHENSFISFFLSFFGVQGVDFYFPNRAHAVKFIDFLQVSPGLTPAPAGALLAARASSSACPFPFPC